MPTPTFLTTCTEKKKLTHDVYAVKFRLPEGHTFSFKAGQFVLWDVPLALPRTEAEHHPLLMEKLARGEFRSSASGAWVENPADVQPRAYSIASPPAEREELTFVLRYKPGGRASRWVAEVLKVGDTLRIQGPLGHFVLDRRTKKDYVFVGTGTGIAPFRSHLLWALMDAQDSRPMDLFFGVRHEEDLFWLDELRSFEEQFSNFHAYISLSQPLTSWRGLCGRVTDILSGTITKFDHVSVYICGNPAMVKDVREWFLQKGVPKQDVHTEGYV